MIAASICGFTTVGLMKVGNGEGLTEEDVPMWVLETTLDRIRVSKGKASLMNLKKCGV